MEARVSAQLKAFSRIMEKLFWLNPRSVKKKRSPGISGMMDG